MILPPEKRWWRQQYADHPGVWPIYEDFKVFLRLVWEHLGLPEPTPVQLDIADYLQDGPKRRIIQGFRGVGKSYVTSAFVCWLLLRDPDLSIMVVSAGKDRADDFSTFTKRLISEIDLLSHLAARRGQRDSNVAFDVGPARAKHSPSVKSVGILGQLTGSRADIIIADDIEVPNNAETQMMREKLSTRAREFDAVLKPGGEVIALGTPQTEQSVYNKLAERGYVIRIWPSEIPDAAYVDRLGLLLAPMVLRMLERGRKAGDPVDPKRFDKIDLSERRLSYGASGYALQFMLDTALSDANRYPLRLRDLIVMPLDAERAPVAVSWGPKPENIHSDLFTPGMDGDAFYRPAFTDDQHQDYQGAVMFVDPSGRGSDETTWAVAKLLNAMVFVPLVKGTQGGYGDDVLRRIALDAKTQKVNTILVEENFGQGMFSKLLQPHLAALGYSCVIEEKRSNRQKELRIIDTLEPLMNQHRLVMGEDVVTEDDRAVQAYPKEKQQSYRLFFQMTRVCREKGALAHDDRLDALAGAVSFWVEAMAQDQQKASEKAKDKLMEKELRWHYENQLFSDPTKVGDLRRSRRRQRRDGGFVGL